MTWQQAVILSWLVAGAAISIFSTLTDKELSTGAVFVAIMIILGIRIGAAIVLSSAGFW